MVQCATSYSLVTDSAPPPAFLEPETLALHRTFPIHDLSDDEFETLAAAICYFILGTGTVVFAAGPDGGRDGAFHGTATKFPSAAAPLVGKFIVQAKHTQNPAASCSDSAFNRTLIGEHPKLVKLIEKGELEHYLLFTNRKKPASDSITKEAALVALGLASAHLIGIEQLRLWLTLHPEIWTKLGFDRFETPLRIQVDDLTTVVSAFHETITGSLASAADPDFTYVTKPKKNKINKLTDEYWEEIRTRSLPYFKTIEDFLRNPRNIDFKDMYEDTADEIRRKLIATSSYFATFDDALTYVIDLVTTNNPDLNKRRRFASIFLHYMYYTCDIGQHANPVEKS